MFSLPPATKLGQGYVFTGVCDSVNRGMSASVHAGIHPPGADTPLPLGADTPQSRHTPWEQTPPQEQTPPGSDTPSPREQTPSRSDTSPPPEQTPPPRRACWEIRSTRGGTHPTGMRSCFFVEVSKWESLNCCYQSMSGPVQYEKISGSLACWCITDSLSHTTYVETNKIARA